MPTLFRRSKTETETSSTAAEPARPGSKGRPTPTRKEAEAAARARARSGTDRKTLARQARAQRAEQTQKVRQAMRTGDERHYLPRDQGPERRYCRDLVDSRFSVAEMMLPLLVISIVAQMLGFLALSNAILMTTLLLVVVDMVLLRFKLRRELKRRFPDSTHKGTTYYTLTRTMQMKFMRLPKAQVKIGEQLPEQYR